MLVIGWSEQPGEFMNAFGLTASPPAGLRPTSAPARSMLGSVASGDSSIRHACLASSRQHRLEHGACRAVAAAVLLNGNQPDTL